MAPTKQGGEREREARKEKNVFDCLTWRVCKRESLGLLCVYVYVYVYVLYERDE